MAACVACASANTEPLPDFVLETHDRDGKPHAKPIKHPNASRTRQEHKCLDCGAYFVEPPNEAEAAAMRASKKDDRGREIGTVR